MRYGSEKGNGARECLGVATKALRVRHGESQIVDSADRILILRVKSPIVRVCGSIL